MEQKRKEMIALAVAAISFILLVALPVILFGTGIGFGAVVSTAFIILVIVWAGSLIAAVEYSESGWTIEGSTLEWIIAAMFSPFLTLILYFVSKDQEEGEAIDPNDYERLGRL
jgi:hypothetical protein